MIWYWSQVAQLSNNKSWALSFNTTLQHTQSGETEEEEAINVVLNNVLNNADLTGIIDDSSSSVTAINSVHKLKYDALPEQ